MTDCLLEQVLEGKWWCPICDPYKHRLLPKRARRNCKVKVLECRIAGFVASGLAGCDETEILRRLAICRRPECAKQFTGNNCRRYMKRCRVSGNWFRSLIAHVHGEANRECPEWSKST